MTEINFIFDLDGSYEQMAGIPKAIEHPQHYSEPQFFRVDEAGLTDEQIADIFFSSNSEVRAIELSSLAKTVKKTLATKGDYRDETISRSVVVLARVSQLYSEITDPAWIKTNREVSEAIGLFINSKENFIRKLVEPLKHPRSAHTDEDLIGEGKLGFLEALQRYDLNAETKVITFCTYRIRGAAVDAARNTGGMIRSSRLDIKRSKLVEERVALGYTLDNIAYDLDIDVARLEYSLARFRLSNVTSLNKLVDQSDDGAELGELVPIHSQSVEEQVFLATEPEIDIQQLIESLPEKYRDILLMRFGFPPYYEPHSNYQIGVIYGFSGSRTSQIVGDALDALYCRLPADMQSLGSKRRKNTEISEEVIELRPDKKISNDTTNATKKPIARRSLPKTRRKTDRLKTPSSSSTQRYLNEIGQYFLLSPEDELRLARQIRQGVEAQDRLKDDSTEIDVSQRERDMELVKLGAEAKKEFIQSNLRLVVYVAKKYRKMAGDRFELLDLIQEGNIGLEHAVDKFDPSKGKFSTYAIFWIRQSINNGILKRSRLIRLPVQMSYDVNSYSRYKFEENDDELLERFGWEPEYLAKVKKAYRANDFIDTDDVIKEDTSTTYGEVLLTDSKDEREYDDRDSQILMQEMMHTLSTILNDREMMCLRMRVGLTDKGEKASYPVIGERFGLTSESARRMFGRVIEKLKSPENAKKMEPCRILLQD